MIAISRKFAAAIACAALAQPLSALAAEEPKSPVAAQKQKEAAKKPHNVVLHVTDKDPVKWNQALNNSANLQSAMGKNNVDIEIVVNGPGLDMMKFDSVVADRMTEALNRGVALLACGTTMKAANVTEKDLHTGVKVVPGGVVEIMQKQEAGWSYLKI